MFEAEKGSLQFCFGEETYEYYTSSLLRFDLRRYLYYRLKEAGYQRVFFADSGGSEGNGIEGRILACDRVSSRFLQEKQKQNGEKKGAGFLSMLLGQAPHPGNVKIRNQQVGRCSMDVLAVQAGEGSKDELSDWICDALSGNGKKALVISLSVLDALYSDSKRNRKLCEVLNSSFERDVLLLVLCPMDAKRCSSVLLKKNGPFDSSLCQELQQMIQRDEAFPVFEELSAALGPGERYYGADQLSYKQIRNMLQCGMLFDGWSDVLAVSEADRYAGFLWAVFHSAAFARKHEMLRLSDVPGTWRDISKLRYWLSTRGNREKFAGYLDECGFRMEAHPEIAMGRHSAEQNQRVEAPIFTGSKSYAKLETISIGELEAATEKYCAETDIALLYEEICSRSRTYWADRDLLEPEILWGTGQIRELLKLERTGAEKKTLADALYQTVRFLYYCVTSGERESQPEWYQQKITNYKGMIRNYFSLLQLKEQQAQQNAKLHKYEERTEELGEIILSRLKQGESNLDESVEYKQLETSMKNIRYILEFLKNQIATVSSLISHQEMVVSAVGIIPLNREGLSQAMKMYQDSLMDMAEEMKQVDGLDTEVQKITGIMDEVFADQEDPQRISQLV